MTLYYKWTMWFSVAHAESNRIRQCCKNNKMWLLFVCFYRMNEICFLLIFSVLLHGEQV